MRLGTISTITDQSSLLFAVQALKSLCRSQLFGLDSLIAKFRRQTLKATIDY
jgi:hypothetical protein